MRDVRRARSMATRQQQHMHVHIHAVCVLPLRRFLLSYSPRRSPPPPGCLMRHVVPVSTQPQHGGTVRGHVASRGVAARRVHVLEPRQRVRPARGRGGVGQGSVRHGQARRQAQPLHPLIGYAGVHAYSGGAFLFFALKAKACLHKGKKADATTVARAGKISRCYCSQTPFPEYGMHRGGGCGMYEVKHQWFCGNGSVLRRIAHKLRHLVSPVDVQTETFSSVKSIDQYQDQSSLHRVKVVSCPVRLYICSDFFSISCLFFFFFSVSGVDGSLRRRASRGGSPAQPWRCSASSRTTGAWRQTRSSRRWWCRRARWWGNSMRLSRSSR